MGKFSKRSYQKEIMDDLDFEGPILDQTLKELRVINKLLGGNKVTTSGMKKLTQKYPQPSYTIADIGCGGGDMIRVMHDWAGLMNINCTFIGVDANAHTIKLAKENLQDISQVSFQVQNVFDPSFLSNKVDIITCTLFTHHFTNEELIVLLSAFEKKARLGIVINDLHRHPIAFHSISLLTWFFSRSPMVKNDGPLSVLRGFKKSDLISILELSGLSAMEISWQWAFRWRVVCYI